jgi:predicted O-methyltransferase YrrM
MTPFDFLHPPGRHPAITGGPGEPWLTREFIDLFHTWDTKRWRAAEFGAGTSTLWLAGRCAHVVSVEHIEEVVTQLRPVLPAHVDLRHRTFKDSAYQHALDDLADGSLDFLLVDGRRRVECIEASTSKVRHGGIVALDNAEREGYKLGHDFLTPRSLSYCQTFNGQWRTDYWIMR